jgi:hypothetical protein
MKIVIDNITFPYDEGCRLLKLKHTECLFPSLAEFWNDITPMTFAEIAKFNNLEHRRVGMLCLGLERLVEQINPILIDRQTIKKKTTWINSKGELETVAFDDTYELFEVSGELLNKGSEGWQKMEACHYVKFKDTSTDRQYMIWVDIQNVYRTNYDKSKGYFSFVDFTPKMVNAIQAIAWTMQVNVDEDNIEKIIRQGDCILVKPKEIRFCEPRHLTEKEYRTLLVAES